MEIVTIIYKNETHDVMKNPVWHTFGEYRMEVYQTLDGKVFPKMYCRVIKYKNTLDECSKDDIMKNIKGLTRDELEYLLIKELSKDV